MQKLLCVIGSINGEVANIKWWRKAMPTKRQYAFSAVPTNSAAVRAATINQGICRHVVLLSSATLFENRDLLIGIRLTDMIAHHGSEATVQPLDISSLFLHCQLYEVAFSWLQVRVK